MAFTGTLDSLGIIEVLQLVCMTRKTGLLSVAHPIGEARYLYFEEGDVTAATSTAAKDRLGYLLVKMGLLSEEAVELARQDEMRTGVKQGASLVDQGLLTEAQLDQALARQVSQIFYGLMAWHEGIFEFLDEDRPGPDVFRVRRSVTSLLMEGTRQLDEWGIIQNAFPSFDVVLSMAPQRENSGPISLNPDEWQILTLIDGRRTIRDVCALSSFSNFDACKKLLNLHHAGLIVTTSTASASRPPPPPVHLVPDDFLPAVRTEFTRHVGPIADILLDEVAQTMGVPLDQLPASRVTELAAALCREVDSPNKRDHLHGFILEAARS